MMAAIVSVRTVAGPMGDAALLGLLVAVGAVSYVAALALVAPGLFGEVRGLLTDVMRRPADKRAGHEALQS
jgi:hypothetical protein